MYLENKKNYEQDKMLKKHKHSERIPGDKKETLETKKKQQIKGEIFKLRDMKMNRK